MRLARSSWLKQLNSRARRRRPGSKAPDVIGGDLPHQGEESAPALRGGYRAGLVVRTLRKSMLESLADYSVRKISSPLTKEIGIVSGTLFAIRSTWAVDGPDRQVMKMTVSQAHVLNPPS